MKRPDPLPYPDRRRFPRLLGELPISYRALSTDLVESRAKDIGGGGLRVMVAEPFKMGTMLVVDVQLPDHDCRIGFIGEVVWCQRPAPNQAPGVPLEVGLKFIKIDPGDQLSIMKYVHRELERDGGQAGGER